MSGPASPPETLQAISKLQLAQPAWYLLQPPEVLMKGDLIMVDSRFVRAKKKLASVAAKLLGSVSNVLLKVSSASNQEKGGRNE